jgi:hypothetical protein
MAATRHHVDGQGRRMGTDLDGLMAVKWAPTLTA